MTAGGAARPVPSLDGPMVDGEEFARRVNEQLLAALIHTGRHDLVESYPQWAAEGAGADYPYYLALARTRKGEVEAALALVRGVLRQEAGHQPARMLAYRLLQFRADEMARESKWQEVVELVTEAVRFSPEGADPRADLARFRDAVPMALLRSGRREEAARLWEQQLREQPGGLLTIHHLALLHSWWACGEDEKEADAVGIVSRWRPAIQYWCVLQQAEAFWSGWAEARARTWGFSISPEDLEALRARIPEEQFHHRFQDRLDHARQEGRAAMAEAYGECLRTVYLEERSARCWRSACALLPEGVRASEWLKRSAAGEGRQGGEELLNLPGGVGFFRHWGLLPRVAEMARKLESIDGTSACVADLRVLFSAEGLGEVYVEIEDRKDLEEAMARLERLPQAAQALVEFTFVHSLALLRRGEQFLAQGDGDAALGDWKRAYESARKESGDAVFRQRFYEIAGRAQGHVLEAVEKKAGELRARGETEAAIEWLERWMGMDRERVLQDRLYSYLCDRAGEYLKGDEYVAADGLLQRALKLKPETARARQMMGLSYNNQGCDEKTADKSIELLEMALLWDPANHKYKENLAIKLRVKAVARVNGASGAGARRAVEDGVKLLERAYGLVSSELKPEALGIIRSMAEIGANLDEVIGSLNDAELKQVVENLAVAYRMRARLRR